MAYFNIDSTGRLEDVTIVLCHRNKTVIGTLYPISDYKTTDSLNDAATVSFSFYRSINGQITDMYDKITDLQLLYIPEKSKFYEISVTEEENEEGLYKTISGTDLCSAELGQTILRNLEFNTESDMERDDYKPCYIYDNTDSSTIANSLIPRILKDKTPHYSIKHIDKTLGRLQRSFSIDGISIIDFLRNDLSEEIDCLVVTDSIDRSISLYDMLCNCNDCGYRGDNFNDRCPECGGTNYTKGYGNNTNIVVSVENLAENITVETDKDSVKNCFYVTGGDDTMTNMVAACNPNGTNYIYKYSEEQLADMPPALSDKISSYNNLYTQLRPQYKAITLNIFNLLDEISSIKYGKADTESPADTDCEKELEKILNSNICAVSISSLRNAADTTINNAITSYMKIFLSSGYSVRILDGSSYNSDSCIWTGRIRIYKTSNDEIYADSSSISITIDENYISFLEQKISKILAKYDIKNSENEPDWTQYSLSPLSSFESAYQSCLDVLIEQGCGSPDNDCYSIYRKYYERHSHIENQIASLESEVEKLNEELDICYKQQFSIQEQLDFHKYIGEELWLIFSAYRREDDYSNSNYISDGLNNEEVLQHAEELLEKANIELNKACQPVYTVSSSIDNFLMMEEFRNFREQCELGNWIYIQTSYDDVYKLRILEISVNDNDVKNIDIKFSNAIKLNSGVDIVKTAISKAQSMATSYDSVKQQAGSGKEASDNMDIWLQEGLDASLYSIKNNAAEEIIIDNSGLTCKSYDDTTADYSPEQFKATHSVIAFTDDNWITVKTALGKALYYYYDNGSDTFINTTGYGVTSQFVNSGYILGSQMVGGDLYSPNFCKTDKTGTHVDLINAEFEFYGNGNGSQLILTHNNNNAQLQMLKGRIIAGQIYSTDYNSLSNDNNGELLDTPMTGINLDDGTFSFAKGALRYDNSQYMVFSKGGFRVENNNSNVCGVFDSHGIDLWGSTNNHIGNFYIGSEGLTLDLGYDFENRQSAESSDYNLLQILGASDTCDNKASIRLRTPADMLDTASSDRIQTELFYNGLTVQPVKFNNSKHIYEITDTPSVKISNEGISTFGSTDINAMGISTSKCVNITSGENLLFNAANTNGTSFLSITQNSLGQKINMNVDVNVNNGKLRCINDIEVNGMEIAAAIRNLQSQVAALSSFEPTA